jgi:hypothetical protein
MTAAGLKALYKRNAPEGHFFDRATMRFFGDSMRNFGVRDGGKVKTAGENGIEEAEVWELIRKRPVQCGRHGHLAYFRKDSGREVFTCGGGVRDEKK